MSARCTECQEHVAPDPYEDEKQSAGECDGYCGRPICEDCATRLGGICTACKKGLEE
jgi:hypothetical protein